MNLRCIFADCQNPHHSRGMCSRHYGAWKTMKDKPPGLGAGIGPAWRVLRCDNEMLRRRVAELEAQA